MDDPTVFEGTFPTLVKEIEGGDGEQKLQKASAEVASCPSYHIMTINMSDQNDNSAGIGKAGKQREVLNVISSSFPASIIFCQELPGCFEKEVVPEGYTCVKNQNEAAVIWDTKKFDASDEGLKTTDQ